ncbi:MAG TPA: hypothetical protein VM537_04455 [Anaerolineae bacterium]|nr:hypothetical protein [Anaerolineae bacterium]
MEQAIDLHTAFNTVIQTEPWKVLRGACPSCGAAVQKEVPAEVRGTEAWCEKCGARMLLTEGGE